MGELNYVGAMNFVAERLNKNNLDWFFYGSSNLALQGIDVSVHDIDVYLSETDLKKVKEIFLDKDYLPIRTQNSCFGGNFKKCFIYVGDFEVEFAEGEFGEEIIRNKNYLEREINGNIFRLNKLENELKTYQLMGREEKVEKLKKFLGI